MIDNENGTTTFNLRYYELILTNDRKKLVKVGESHNEFDYAMEDLGALRGYKSIMCTDGNTIFRSSIIGWKRLSDNKVTELELPKTETIDNDYLDNSKYVDNEYVSYNYTDKIEGMKYQLVRS